jgi:DNA-directed RNA polymerase subunit RPC12/RpoP
MSILSRIFSKPGHTTQVLKQDIPVEPVKEYSRKTYCWNCGHQFTQWFPWGTQISINTQTCPNCGSRETL